MYIQANLCLLIRVHEYAEDMSMQGDLILPYQSTWKYTGWSGSYWLEYMNMQADLGLLIKVREYAR